MNEYIACDGTPVEVGRKFWNNDLRVVRIVEVAKHSNDYRGEGTQTWHEVDEGNGRRGSFDTLSIEVRWDLYKYGRLVRKFQGKDAEDYEPGTNYADVK